MIVGLRYCPRNWPIVRLRDSTLWLLAHRYRSRVPASAFLCMTLSPRSRRRAPPFLRNKRAARSHDVSDRSLSFSLCLYLYIYLSLSPFLSPLTSLRTIIANYCERKKKIAPIRIFTSLLCDEPLIRLVASRNFLHCNIKQILLDYF